jgi:CRISPR-associated endoribonuclease Cas6
MLTSLVMQLQAPTDMTLPASLGRAVQALLLGLIERQDAGLSAELHQAEGPKPYTASNLVLGKRQAGLVQVQAGQSGWVRFTGLTTAVSERLQALAAQPPQAVEIDGRSLQVTGATLAAAKHPWAAQISYQDLAAPYLLGGEAAGDRRIGLEFATPTTFRSNGRYIPLPQPELVFGSLLDRWQAFAPIALHPEVRRFAAEAVALSRYQLRTRGTPYKQGGMQIGFTGEVTFVALNQDRYWLNVLHLLAAFAFYSGVGYQTGSGLGQVRPGRGAREQGRRGAGRPDGAWLGQVVTKLTARQ